MNEKIRVLVVDDHALVREGITSVLETAADIEIVGQAANGVEAVHQAAQLCPDVILLDLVMPGGDGLEAIRQIRATGMQTHILVLTSFAEDEKIFAAIQAGAHGYLLKDSLPQQLLEGIHDVQRGKLCLSPAVTRSLLRKIQQSPQAPTVDEALTSREVEVLGYLACGLSSKEIARKISISERTVNAHIGSILKKLHLANRTQAALYAQRQGFLISEEKAGQD